MGVLHVDTPLISRLDAAQFACVQGRLNAVCEVRGDRSLARFVEWEHLRCTLSPGIPNPLFNVVRVSGPVHLPDVTGALEAYQRHDLTPSIEVSPGAASAELADLLSEHGLRHTDFHPIFVRLASDLTPNSPAGIEVERVGEAELDTFAEVYLHGWQTEDWLAPHLRSYIAHWPRQRGYELYLAREQGAPIAVAVLFVFEDVCYLADAATSPEHRSRGAQSALIAARVARAKELGAQIVLGQAEFGSSSQRNMERAGLPVCYARAVWKRE
jgi:GNAT superfamily N-acetyltransferase